MEKETPGVGLDDKGVLQEPFSVGHTTPRAKLKAVTEMLK
jgi:hypothetical protein